MLPIGIRVDRGIDDAQPIMVAITGLPRGQMAWKASSQEQFVACVLFAVGRAIERAINNAGANELTFG
jgi:hypothetical protein